jgi:lysophospholipase L1-like esterase
MEDLSDSIALFLILNLIFFFLLTFWCPDYRIHHGHAPRPENSRGLIIVRHDDDDEEDDCNNINGDDKMLESSFLNFRKRWNNHTVSSRNNHPVKDDEDHHSKRQLLPPLRLLVIGDSLAAGVGTSRSSTPVLPESIAQALSKALRGRAVHWTCIGVPGQTSAQIVQLIQTNVTTYDDEDVNDNNEQEEEDNTNENNAQKHASSTDVNQHEHGNPNVLIRKWEEWKQAASQHNIQLPQRPEWMIKEDTPQVERQQRPPRMILVRWWNGLCQDYVPKQWQFWNTNTRQSQKQTVPNSSSSSSSSTLFRINSKYDVAIVLTGLNDLKDSYLPFMMTASSDTDQTKSPNRNDDGREGANADASSCRDQQQQSADGLQRELIRILHALEDKMKVVRPTQQIADGNQGHLLYDSNIHGNHDYGADNGDNPPLIVFPALPYEPTVLRQHVPLSWFVVPLLDMVDRHKRALAEMYPGRVVYVEPPDRQVLMDAEAKRGDQWQDFRVLLKLDDIAHHVKERVERLMEQHYDRWMEKHQQTSSVDQDPTNWETFLGYDNSLYQIDDCGISLVDMETIRRPGSRFVAPDGIHPNDHGYSMWGRHIASAIVKEWESHRTRQSFNRIECTATECKEA